MAEGEHPVPSRTRQLSPPAPMVLPGRPGGRVGRRRDIFEKAARASRGRPFRFRLPSMHRCPGPCSRAPEVYRAIELLERSDAGAAVSEAAKAKALSSRSSSVREVLGLALYGPARFDETL